jgi:AcrR family transcriptional regulator
MTTERIQQRMLAAFRPGDATDLLPRWQQRKSAQTRLRLIEAAVECLVEGGYVGLSTAAVAVRCKVSRGTMHHHFATRLALVAAVVEHVFYQRMRSYLESYFTALRGGSEELLVEIACEQHWHSVQSREYAAYLELAVAARTDADLEACFAPAAQRFDEVWTSEMIEAFPEWRAHWDAFKLASDFTLAAHMGLLLHAPTFGSGERVERVRDLIAGVVRSLYDSP